jgi:HEAT repeat protein/cyclophilin family peptidyl-prolyl cis-trans isomerase
LALGRVNDTLALDSAGLALTADKDASVRAMAAFSLGPPRWRSGGPILLKALETEKDPTVITDILRACGSVYTRDGYETIMPFLRHKDPRVRVQAALTLDIINRNAQAGDSIAPLIDDPDPVVRWAALFSLVRAESDAAAKRALPICRDTSVSLRRLAYRVVGGSQIEGARDTLLQGLSDPDPSVRSAVAETFGVSVDTNQVLAVFPYLESEKDPRVLVSLIKAIGEHWRSAAEPYLKKLAAHPNPSVRAAAYRALPRRLDFTFARLIAPAANDPSPPVRQAYLDALDEMKTYVQNLNIADYLHELEILIADTIPAIRAHAIQTYISLQGPESERYLNQLYNDPDPQCVLTAVSLIGSYRVAHYQDSLYALYPKYADQWRPEMKWTILATTANLSPSVFADSVRSDIFNWGMTDPNRLVRWYSIAVWDKFREDRREELGRYYTDLTEENVKELLHSFAANPLATLNTTQGPITLELRADLAPRTVRQFVKLTRDGVYDNCPMNEILPFSLVHTGDRRGDGWGLPDETVRDEITPERVKAGSVIWVINSRDSGHGAFAIALERLPYLDWRYGIFAQVVDGLDRAASLTMADSIRTVTISVPGA